MYIFCRPEAEKADEPPAKLLDDLFLKTKAAPCIYWLPLTEEQVRPAAALPFRPRLLNARVTGPSCVQVLQKLLDRSERQKERERRHKEQKEEEEKKREDEKKERLKAREKDGGAAAGSGVARGADGERDRGREREGDKKRDGGHRPRRPSEGAVGGRHSRSRSNPRDRRR